jgi:4-amino-4-deoxy-L-arabinose transferase-like glycosyltransferase
MNKKILGEDEFSSRSWRFALAAIALVAALTRIAVVARGFGTLDDPDNYLSLARSLADGRGFMLEGRSTAYRPPLYPIVLVPLVAALGDRIAWGIAVLHVALGGATAVLAGVAARRWGMSHGRALIAALIVACDPVLVSQARMVMTETLAAFLVVATIAALAEGGWRGTLAGGVGFGLASLCRPSLLPAAVLAMTAAAVAGPGTRADRLRRAALLGLATLATMTPWAWRNARVFGEPVWTTTHGGYTLALANNPVYYADVLDGPPGAVWSGPNQRRWFVETTDAMAGLSEPESDRRLRDAALRLLWDRPRDFARASLARLGRFWGVSPAGAVYPRALRLATSVWTIPLWIALGLGLLRRTLWSWPQVTAPIFVLSLSAVHAVYWTDMRMRAPIVPAIALIAASARGRVNRPFDRPPESKNGFAASDRKKIQNPHGF